MRLWARGVALCMIVLLFLGTLYYKGLFGSHYVLLQTTYNQLPGWEIDDQSEALSAFKQSCLAIEKLDPNQPYSTLPSSKKVADWQVICKAANQLKQVDKKTAREFFEYWFQPYRVANNFNPNGLFTGYYLPIIHASLHHDSKYIHPIYGLPNDLIKLNLVTFHPGLKGKIIIGKFKNNTLITYPDREMINAGVLKNKAQILAWSDSPIDVFFAQIQGSAIVQLNDNKKFMINYAGDNGHPYVSIGKVLIQNGALTPAEVSMQSIRHWLETHPEKMDSVLNQNKSYVFFNILKDDKVLGTQQVPLTPKRSLAVDPHFVPLGTPVWLNTDIPDFSSNGMKPFQQLLVAQDTGGAINGIVRGDVFWGEGDFAAYAAGHMKSRGQYWLLLPKN